MAIRDFSGWSDDQVPAWVRERREADRAARNALRRRTCSCGTVLPGRNYLLGHLDVKTDHRPLVEDRMDACLARYPMCADCAWWRVPKVGDLCQMCAHKHEEAAHV